MATNLKTRKLDDFSDEKKLEEILQCKEGNCAAKPGTQNEEIMGLGIVFDLAAPDNAINTAKIKPNILSKQLPPITCDIIPPGESGLQQDVAAAKILAGGRALVGYAQMIFQKAGGGTERKLVLAHRKSDAALVPEFLLNHPFFGKKKKGEWGGVPWNQALSGKLDVAGLMPPGVKVLTNEENTSYTAVIAVTDADIDTDGPGGNPGADPNWQPETSLRHPSGLCCDSRQFLGVVVPPQLTKLYGIRAGDFALVAYKDKVLACQVYDQGPADKVGEISVKLALDLGIYPAGTTWEQAAKGNSVKDLVTVFFPGSGNGTAVPQELTTETAAACWQRITGRVPQIPTGDFVTFFDAAEIPVVKAGQLMINTSRGANSVPDKSLWGNIIATAAVLGKLMESDDIKGKKLSINSAYRNKAYNGSVGGASSSQHLDFRAIDFSVEGVSPSDLAAKLKAMRGTTFTTKSKFVMKGDLAPLNQASLGLTGTDTGMEFTWHGGISAYATFVHMDSRGDDTDW